MFLFINNLTMCLIGLYVDGGEGGRENGNNESFSFAVVLYFMYSVLNSEC